MVVLHLTSLWEMGGAADYTRNIHLNMLADGYRSYVAVAGKQLVLPDGRVLDIPNRKMSLYDKIVRRTHDIYLEKFKVQVSDKYAGYNLKERVSEYYAGDIIEVLPELPDIIIVHWVTGFANAKYVRDLQKYTGAKVYYIMIDEAILSGGCHYPWDCEGYQNGCKKCKMSSSIGLQLIVRWNYLFKKYYLVKDKNVIAPTEFDVKRLAKSPLWEGCTVNKLIEIIDEDLFRPVFNKTFLREKYNIPLDKKIVFFGCSYFSEVRKGMSVLVDALSHISRQDFVYLVAGRDESKKLPSNHIYLGHLDMKSLAEAYQASDIFVCPSLEDSGPQMINMAIMSGVPTVAFEMGVSLDLVHTGETGYRAKFNDPEDLAKGIEYLLNLSESQYQAMSQHCRDIALQTFSKRCQRDFFNNLLIKK